MASEERDDAVLSFTLPPDVDDWVAGHAERRDESRGATCRRILAAAAAVATDDGVDEAADREDVEDLRAQVDAQREEFVDLLEDVRHRVVQVKREADAKAAADHDHPEHARADDLDELATELEGLVDEFDALERTVREGFENFESVLEHLVDETDDLAERSDSLATAVLDLREDTSTMAVRDRRRAAADELKLAANRLGIRRADCEECGTGVDLALLARPECPHCARPFSDVEKRRSLFGSHTLVTGEPPALPGRVEGEDADLDAEETDGPAGGPDADEMFEFVDPQDGGEIDGRGTIGGRSGGANAGEGR